MCVCPVRKVNANGTVSYFPCGHCFQCLKAYQDQWSARLAEECKAWKAVPQDGRFLPPVVFFTLHYRNDSIPCTYLCLSALGWYLSDEKPSCEVDEMWTDTRRENHRAWKARRASILERFRSMYASALEKYSVASARFNLVPVYNEDGEILRWIHARESVENPSILRTMELLCDDGEKLPHCYDHLRDLPEAAPFYAVEFHSVSKTDVQFWLKRSRRRFEYGLGLEPGSVSSRQCTTWIDPDGVEMPLPDACLTKSFKYFITSEYGPRTHRPHYHGVLFGVTYEEFDKYFREDWETTFGSLDFSAYDSSRGGMTYLSKYCSKGGYEHPYCRKDFFYKDKEFHSRHFEDSIKDFFVDAPLVSPTFHLISKGIGARYAFAPEIQKYFGVRLAQFLTDTGKVRYMASDSDDSLALGHCPSAPVSELFLATPDMKSLAFSLSIDVREDGSLLVTKWTVDKDRQPKYPVASSVIPLDGVVDSTVEALLSNQKYNRTYAKRSSPYRTPVGRSYNLPRWHFVHTFGADLPKIKTQSISLPRYYRQFLLSPLASALRSAASRRCHSALDAEAKRAVFDRGLRDALGPEAEPLVRTYEAKYLDGYARFRVRSNRDYSPSGVYEID